MIQQAISSDDPVLFFEPKRATGRRASSTRPPVRGSGCTEARRVPPGEHRHRWRRNGPMGRTALEAAASCAEPTGTSVEVVDLRSLSQLDLATAAVASVEKHTAGLVGSTRRRFSSDSARRSPRGSPSSASTASKRPCSASAGSTPPYPASRLEEEYLPDLDRVLDAVDRALAF
jgi:pyruvate dehydrogenase E1 component beta subunit